MLYVQYDPTGTMRNTKGWRRRIGTYKVLIKYNIVLLVLLRVCSEGDSGLNETTTLDFDRTWPNNNIVLPDGSVTKPFVAVSPSPFI